MGTNQVGRNECLFVDRWLQNLLPRSALYVQIEYSTQISTITMYMGGIRHYVHGYWPQRSGKSQSVNRSNSLTNIHFKSGGWPGFEPGSLTFMASALTTKLPTKLVEMSARLLTDGSITFYQGLHCTCRYNTQLKFQQLLCTWVALGTTYMGAGPNGLDKVSL